MGLSRTGCFHVVCILVSKPYKKIHQTIQYATVVSDFRGRHTNTFCTWALDAACPSQRDVKVLHSVWMKGLKHRPARFLFWPEIQLLDRNSWLPAKLVFLYYLSGLGAIHLGSLLPKRGTAFSQEHQTEPWGSALLQWTTESGQRQTLVQCFLSVNAFHPVASFTSRLGLCLNLHLPRIKSLLPPPTW